MTAQLRTSNDETCKPGLRFHVISVMEVGSLERMLRTSSSYILNSVVRSSPTHVGGKLLILFTFNKLSFNYYSMGAPFSFIWGPNCGVTFGQMLTDVFNPWLCGASSGSPIDQQMGHRELMRSSIHGYPHMPITPAGVTTFGEWGPDGGSTTSHLICWALKSPEGI